MRYLYIIFMVASGYLASGQTCSIIAPPASCALTPVPFQADTLLPPGNYTLTWDFGGLGTATGQTAFFEFPPNVSDQNYTVTLNVTGDSTCTTTHNILINATPDPSVTALVTSFTQCNGPADFMVTLENQSVTTATDTLYVLCWGDGSQCDTLSSFSTPFSHDYANYGAYTVTVEVFGPGGCGPQSEDYQVFNGSNPGVIVQCPTGTGNLCAPATVCYDLSQNMNSPGTLYEIRICGNLVFSEIQENLPPEFCFDFTQSSCGINCTPADPNSYLVEITASNPCDFQTLSCSTLRVNTPPDSEFDITAPFGFCPDEPISFSNTSTGEQLNMGTCEAPEIVEWIITDPMGNDTTYAGGPQTLTETFDVPGDWLVTLIVTGGCGGTVLNDTSTQVLTIEQLPVPDFTHAFTASGDCAPATVLVTNQSLFASSYIWTVTPQNPANNGCFSFVNGTDNMSVDPEIEFVCGGLYDICLVSINSCDQSPPQCITIEVEEDPTIDLDINMFVCDSICLNPFDFVVFSDTAVIDSVYWMISLDTVFTSNQVDPGEVCFTTPGVHEVIVEAFSFSCGTMVADTGFVTVEVLPVPAFTYDLISADSCAPVTISLNNFSTGDTSLIWTITPSAGVTFLPDSLSPEPDIIFIDGGTYLLTQIVSNPCGTDSVSTTILVNEVPDVSMQLDTTDCVPITLNPFIEGMVSFSDTTVNDVQWTFQNGNPAQSSFFDPGMVSFSAFGNHLVTVEISNPTCDTSIVATGVVTIQPPDTANIFPSDTTLCSSSGPYQVMVDSLFPGGIFSGSPAVDASGNYDPSVAPLNDMVIYGGNCIVPDTILITILPTGSVMIDTVDFELCETEPMVQLTASPSGGVFSGTGVSPSGLFDPSGLGIVGGNSIDITYTYTFPTGINCVGTDQITITVHPVLDPAFSYTCDGSSATFSLDDPAQDVMYDWDFGGSCPNSSLANPVCNFGGPGTYPVTLTIFRPGGCTATETQNIVILDPADAGFTFLPSDTICSGQSITYTNTSTGDNLSYMWDFGNDSTNTGFGPFTIAYFAVGNDTTYTVSLNASNACGDDTFISNIVVKTLPVALAGSDSLNVCSGDFLGFANGTSGNPDYFEWYLNEVLISTDVVLPDQQFFTNDTVRVDTIILVAGNECGETEDTLLINVLPANVDAFIQADNGTSACTNETICFSSISTFGGTVQWDMGDGQGFFTTGQVCYQYSAPGMYEVVLTITGCGFDTDTIPVFIDPGPTTDFSHQPLTCVGQSVSFTNLTTGADTYNWYINGVLSSNLFSPDLFFPNIGVDTIILESISVNGCISSDTSTILIQDFAANATAIGPVTCNGENDGIATVSPIGAGGPFQFNWDNGETTATATMLSAGTHAVSITNSIGCETFTTVDISEPPLLTVSAIETVSILCAGEATGEASSIVNGGTPAYTWLWDNGSTNDLTTGLVAGLHILTVTDNNACETTASVTISEPPALTASVMETQAVSCFGFNDGVGEASASGGSGNYTFLWSNGVTNAIATNLDAGIHVVTITDANGCIFQNSVLINQPDILMAIASQVSPVSCNGLPDGIGQVTPTGGTAPYSFIWDNGETNATATNLNAGNHSVTITDFNGCSLEASTDITDPSMLIASAAEISAVTCFGFNDGVGQASGNGGTPPYLFQWENGTTTAIATNLDAGNHNVTITDDNGCTFETSVIISQPPVLAAVAMESQSVSCFGLSDGIGQVNVNGGTAPYTFVWDSGATDATATNLNEGIHSVTITDNNGCVFETTTGITQPDEFSGTVSETSPVSCFGLSDGTGTASITGGTLPYTFTWDSGATGATATNLNAGVHSVSVTDANNCIFLSFVNITQPLILSALAIPTDSVSCFGFSDGGGQVSVSGGSLPYTYNWDNGETTSQASSLTAGNHSITITDVNGCFLETMVSIFEPAPLDVTATEFTPVSCTGLSDGVGQATVTGGTMPYLYLWDSGETDANAQNLDAGQHSITITDANGCATQTTVDITEPAILTATAVETAPVVCNGESNGQATAMPSGGTAPYTFTWDSGSTEALATNLTVGSHSVTITDNNGCVTQTNVMITEPLPLNAIAAELSSTSCFGFSDGTAEAIASGGVLPYTYFWDTGETNATATNLNEGIHAVTITDNNGCSIETMMTTTQPPELVATSSETSPVSCFGFSDGTAEVMTTGGTTPYTYVWDNGVTNDENSSLTSGIHSVTITDTNGCFVISTVSISEPDALSAMTSQLQEVSCFSLSDGSAQISGSGGTPPYSYFWDNGETSETAVNLDAGIHVVTITDANNCSLTSTTEITEPALLSITAIQDQPVICNGESNGQATATPAGGTMPFTFTWDNGNTNATATNLDAGNHSVTITDANGCSSQASVLINEPGLLVATASETSPASCNGFSDGIGTALVSGGVEPYTFLWDSGATMASANNLNEGFHSVTITDANGCTTTASTSITEPLPLLVDLVLNQGVQCAGDADGQAIANVQGGTGPFDFDWDNGENMPVAQQLDAGIHSITVTDINGCPSTAEIFVPEPDTLSAIITDLQMTTCFDGMDGSICIEGSGGTPSYAYLWNNGETTNCISGLASLTYTFTVTDDNGCTFTNSVFVPEEPAFAVMDSVVHISCFGANDGAIIIDSISGGTPPYFGTLIGTDTSATGLSFGSLGPGTYELFVEDAMGCSQNYDIEIVEPFEIFVDIIQSPPSILQGDFFTMTIDHNVANPEIWWSGPDSLFCQGCTEVEVRPLEDALFTVMVTDENGCTALDSLFIEVIPERTIYIPNAFSPNNDGYNDVFMIRSGNPGVEQVNVFRIFDRWGELIFEAENFQPNQAEFGWDGTFKGKTVMPDVFVYYADILYKDGAVITYKGDVTLIK